MNGASSSHPPPPPPPAAAAAAVTTAVLPPAPVVSAVTTATVAQEPESALLAPGFRFHPTDEELVSYYLKRKVFGRPLRVEAIAEVELYKAEPWDLPALSRLRSRDMEWYFFSPLDRKYANRSRTNRATSQGYWKTTGKDRPVRRAARTVGMKKTLVFHVGRAPRGERTNWVMHEYRLEDDELTNTGIPQDSYVVCRIFQKSGTGPQNGAQYGAPFNEEEWEEEGNNMPMTIVDSDGNGDGDGNGNGIPAGNEVAVAAVVGNGEYFQLSDFEQNQDQGNQFETGSMAPDSNVQNIGSFREDDPIFLVESTIPKQEYDGVMDASEPQDHRTSSDSMGSNTELAAHPFSPSQNEPYLEINDFMNEIYPSIEESFDYYLSEVQPLDRAKPFGLSESMETPEAFKMSTSQDDFCLQPKDLGLQDFDFPSDQTDRENPLFYDASSNDLPSGMDNFIQMDDLFPPIDGSGDSGAVEDIASYFASPFNSPSYPTLDGSPENVSVGSSVLTEPDFSWEVPRNVVTPAQAFEAVGASSFNLPGVASRSNTVKENVAVVADSRRVEICDMSIPKRLVNMLGSISAPPAFAAEPSAISKSSARISATNSASSSIHVTAGLIQIRGFEVIGRAEHWSMHRNGDMGFLLSCGVASRKSDNGFESVPKVRGCSMSVMLRGGFYCFLFSALVLALCLKVGSRICSI